jgi:hypothetical protein
MNALFRCGVALLLLFQLDGQTPLQCAEEPLDGAWKWTFTMPDGGRVTPRVRLSRQGELLRGTAIVRGHEAPISNGRIQGDNVSWSVVREHEGRRVTTRYQGKWAGDTIKGTVESDWTGEANRYEWEAKRVPNTPAGTWRWFVVGPARRPGGGRTGARGTNEVRGTFAVDGHKVTGKVTGLGRDGEIRRGRIMDGVFTFELVRERDGIRVVTYYTGRVVGDTIKGDWESDVGLELRRRLWEATRLDD